MGGVTAAQLEKYGGMKMLTAKAKEIGWVSIWPTNDPDYGESKSMPLVREFINGANRLDWDGNSVWYWSTTIPEWELVAKWLEFTPFRRYPRAQLQKIIIFAVTDHGTDHKNLTYYAVEYCQKYQNDVIFGALQVLKELARVAGGRETKELFEEKILEIIR
jgi:hypothetical protein